MNPILTITYLKQYFRIETPVPDEVIEREIAFVRERFAEYLGDVYLDAEQDAEQATPVNPILIDQFKTAMAYLAMVRLLEEDYVLTGFGVVIKRDEYSDPIAEDKKHEIATSYVKSAATTLHGIEAIKRKDVTGLIEASQSAVNGFFSHKNDCTLYKYYPYNIYW